MNDILRSELIRDLKEGRPKVLHAKEEVVNQYFEAAKKVFPRVEKIKCGIRTYIVDMDNSEMLKGIERELQYELNHHTDMANERRQALQDMDAIKITYEARPKK
jgi:hypothetical protein